MLIMIFVENQFQSPIYYGRSYHEPSMQTFYELDSKIMHFLFQYYSSLGYHHLLSEVSVLLNYLD